MMNHRLSSCRTCRSPKGGFTLVELLVVIAIIGLLASVAYPSIVGAYKNAQHNVGMQNSKSIGLAMFQYALDPSNNGTFPAATTSTLCFESLIGSSYLSNATILYLAASGKSVYTGTTPTTSLTAANVGWDIMAAPTAAGSTTITGLTTNSSDDTPLVFSTGNAVNLAATGATTVTMNKTTNPFGTDGMAVCYKGQNASFIKSTVNGSTYTLNITPASYSDQAYQQITP